MQQIRLLRFQWAVVLCVALYAAGCGEDDGDNNGDPDTDIQADADGGTDMDADGGDDMDADGGSDTDGGTTGEGLRLTGGIVPAGGTQMSSSFTLNGGIEQPAESTTVESASFTLELTQPTSQGGTP